MKESKIQGRIKPLLMRLCQEPSYVTISALAKQLQVSNKTVLRDMEEVEQWLAAYGYRLDKKTGTGIRLQADAQQREGILLILDAAKQELSFSPAERQNLILGELLQNQEPVKLYSFATVLKVTEGTISNDLDKLEGWIERHKLQLIRKPGLGVYVAGAEQDIRHAVVRFIYEHNNEEELLGLLRHGIEPGKDGSKTGRRLLNLMDRETISKLEHSVDDAQKDRGDKMADSAYAGLLVHLALAVQRLKKEEQITIDQKLLADLKQKKEYQIGSHIAQSIGRDFSLAVPEDEIGYITMHLLGAKNQYSQEKTVAQAVGSFQLVKLAKEMIRIAEKETGQFLPPGENLLVGLVNHLGPAISRLKMKMDIRNPLLAEIKTQYPELMDIAKVCAKAAETQLGVVMPEAEIGYIAMHLGAALEDRPKSPKRLFRVVVACPTGIGTSKLLAVRIKQEYDNIVIEKVISILHIDTEALQNQQIDFVIATVSLEKSELPVVVVNPLLFQEDKVKINRVMEQVKMVQAPLPVRTKQEWSFKHKIAVLAASSQAIVDILEGFFLLPAETAAGLDAVIRQVSETLLTEEEQRLLLTAALKKREELGGTIITGQEMILLHCRTAAVAKPYFGAIQFQNDGLSVKNNGKLETLRLGIIMLVPENCSKTALEVMSHLSQMLLESTAFRSCLQTGIKDEAEIEIGLILKNYYRLQVKKVLEV